MFAESESSFLRAMCPAVFRWQGLGVTSTKVYRIHGKYDMVIPARGKVDLLLDGGHLISMSHAKECADFVRAHSVQA